MSSSGRSVVFVIAALAACGSVENQGDGDGDPDIDAPAAVSISPTDGSTGVAGDAEIVVVFSEPMDQDSVEAAWTSVELPADDVSFTWNAAGDTLTAIPAQGLPLAEGEGTEPAVVDPLAFSITIGTGATDLAGNPLAAAVATTFTTSRRLFVELQRIESLTRSMNSDGTVFGETAVTLSVGDGDNADRTFKMFVSFELPPQLPSDSVLESAALRGNQNGVTNDPYAFGALRALHVSTGDTLVLADFTGEPLARPGDLSTDDTPGPKSLDVLDAFIDDLSNRAARNERTQYRLEFPIGTDSDMMDDQARFSRSGLGFTVTYLVD